MGDEAARALALGRLEGDASRQLLRALTHYLRQVSVGLLVWGGMAVIGYIFIYPLRSLGVGFPVAMVYAIKSHWLNFAEFAKVGGICMLSALGLGMADLSAFLPVLYAFWMAVNYVMFREVFLGIRQNQPQRAPGMAGHLSANAIT